MKKRVLSLLLAAMMVVPMVACGGDTSTGGATGGDTGGATGDSIPLKVATYYADTHPTSIALEEVFKPMIDEGTEGRYTVELYSNNGLGSETEFNEGVSLGTIECCITGNLMTTVNWRDYYDVRVFGRGKAGKFENLTVTNPAQTDFYLRNLYGDWRKLPPPEARRAHDMDVWLLQDGEDPDGRT